MVNDVSYLPGLGSSDHVCICFNLNCYSEHSEDKLPMHKADYVKIRELLGTVNWQEEIGSLEATEVWNLFSTTIDDAIEDCIPTFRPFTRKNMKGITPKECKKPVWRKYLQTHHSHDYALFTRARNNLRSLTRQLRRNFEQFLATIVLSRTQRASGNMQILD